MLIIRSKWIGNSKEDKAFVWVDTGLLEDIDCFQIHKLPSPHVMSHHTWWCGVTSLHDINMLINHIQTLKLVSSLLLFWSTLTIGFSSYGLIGMVLPLPQRGKDHQLSQSFCYHRCCRAYKHGRVMLEARCVPATLKPLHTQHQSRVHSLCKISDPPTMYQCQWSGWFKSSPRHLRGGKEPFP